MKRCPKCGLEYTDNSLEFCLEDGSRLILQPTKTPQQTVALPEIPLISSVETVNLPYQNVPQTVEIGSVKSTIQEKGQVLKKTVVHQSFKVLEILPIIISLAHNYWQWLYVNNQSYTNLTEFIISVHFLVWLILLIAGAVFSLITIKFCQIKGFAYTSLVILAINFILFLVPKH